jgi:hypothetical protein
MVSGPLLGGAAFGLAAGLVYAYVGFRVSRRRVDAGKQLAAAMFTAWWWGLAAQTLLAATWNALAAFGVLNEDLYVAATHFSIVLIALALGGLLFYLLFLFTGKTFWWKPLVWAYGAYILYLIYFIRSHDPRGYVARGWSVAVDYGEPLRDDPLYLLVVLLLVGPQTIAAALYFSLFFRTREPTLRYRIALVSGSLFTWLISILAASASGFSDSPAWQVISRTIGLLAALTVLAAYFPPAFVRRRGIVSIEQPLPEAAR